MALAHQKDKALLESNLSVWWGSAEEGVVSYPFIYPRENKSDKLWGEAPFFMVGTCPQSKLQTGIRILSNFLEEQSIFSIPLWLLDTKF